MIELNSKTQQDFLNREWVKKLLDVGVNMSDAKYCIGKGIASGTDYILLKSEIDNYTFDGNTIPTYTVSELLYKPHEYIYPTINGIEYSGGLNLWKDAPFYVAQYRLRDKDGKHNEAKFFCTKEYPIESLASLLIQCHKYDIGFTRKDTGDISDK